jgi:pyruvate formate lyase activating enzyme
LKNSTLDFPGRLSAVVFFAGCNYRCYYCHNKHILDDPPLLDAEYVLSFLKKRAGLLEGVVLSGGEASLQGGLYSFARGLGELGYGVKLDTNGSRPDALRAMLEEGLVDYVAADYKAPLSMYEDICGAGPEGVMESFEILQRSGVNYEIRVTMAPMITEKKLLEMAASLPKLDRFVLQLYRPAGELGAPRLVDEYGAPYTPAELHGLAEAARRSQPNVTVRA